MKQLSILFLTCLIFASCNKETSKTFYCVKCGETMIFRNNGTCSAILREKVLNCTWTKDNEIIIINGFWRSTKAVIKGEILTIGNEIYTTEKPQKF